MKTYILLLFGLFVLQMNAQTGIGTTTPHASAKLEVASSSQGFLPPRVALTATNAASPVTAPAEGLMVYNTTSNASIVPGYYYWNGSLWVRLIVPTDNSANVTGTVSVANGGTGTTTGSITGTGALTFAAGGTNQNINLRPSGTGNVILNNNVGIGTTTPGATLEIGSNNGSVPGSLILNPTTTGAGLEGAEVVFRPAPVTTSPLAQSWVIDQVSNANNPRLRFFPSVSGESRGFSILDNGNFGIGTAIPSSKLNIVGGGIKIHNGFSNNTIRPSLTTTSIGNFEIRGVGSVTGSTQDDGGDDGFLRLSAGGGTNTSGQSSIDLSGFSNVPDMSNNIVMRTAGTERLRITNEGRVGIGTSNPASRVHIQSSGLNSLYIESTSTDNNGIIVLNANTDQNWGNFFHEFVFFQRQGNNIGNIAGRDNLVSYNTSSDYRLKTDLRNYSGLNLVNKIKTYDYAWKSDNSRMYGVMAHELQEVIPYAVSGFKDALDKDGKIIPQAVDYSKFTPILIKAIQEQDVKLKEQQVQIDALLKRLELLEAKK